MATPETDPLQGFQQSLVGCDDLPNPGLAVVELDEAKKLQEEE